ncbi:uncharacterized protein LOC117648132 [Thrips palmi]|uniref:Uncharacterized protein LOC117648132 n=1 Tax=Thrips palmi TaxID=161013 RepID=A0A6P8ZCE3_THRPL|nr:uncharacterized protein LOC117648132 [Thrips palmi]
MLQRESNWTASTHPSHDKAVFQQSSSLAVDSTRNRPAMSQHCSGETPLDLSGHKQTYPSSSASFAPPDRMRTDLYQKNVAFQPRAVQNEWQQSRRDVWEERDRDRQTPSTSETWTPPDRMQSELNWREHTAQATGITQGEQSQVWQGRNRQTPSASASCAPPDRMRTDLYQKNVAFQPRAVQNEWQQSRRDVWEERDRDRQTPSTSETWAPPDKMQSDLDWREHTAQATGITQGEQSQGWQGRNRQTPSASASCAPPDRMRTDLYQKNVAFQPRAVQNEWQQSHRDVWEERDRDRQTPSTSETWAPPDRMQSELNWREHTAQVTGITQGEQSQGWQGRNRQTPSASASCGPPDRMRTDLYQKNVAFQPRAVQNEWQQSRRDVWEERDRDRQTPSASETWAPPDKMQSELDWREHTAQATGITQGEQSQGWQGRNRQTPSASASCGPPDRMRTALKERDLSQLGSLSNGDEVLSDREMKDEGVDYWLRKPEGHPGAGVDHFAEGGGYKYMDDNGDGDIIEHNDNNEHDEPVDNNDKHVEKKDECEEDENNNDDHKSLNDDDYEDVDERVTVIQGSSSNFGAIYLPKVNKPNDVDAGKLQDIQKPAEVKPKKQKGKTQGRQKSNLDGLTEKATKYFNAKKIQCESVETPASPKKAHPRNTSVRKAPARKASAAVEKNAPKQKNPPKYKRIIAEGSSTDGSESSDEVCSLVEVIEEEIKSGTVNEAGTAKESDTTAEVLSKGTRGVKLSSVQLDILWKLDSELAHKHLGLPSRTCSAEPNKNWGEPMDNDEFQTFIQLVKRMWMRASLCFEAYLDEHLRCWGLRVNKHHEGKLSISMSSVMKEMGWLACAPTNEMCPTSHRYLRSPTSSNSYLGGPISLSNWAPTKDCTVRCTAHINCDESGKYHLLTVRPLEPQTPILWNYGFNRAKSFPCMHPTSAWKLTECCNYDEEATTEDPVSF